LPTQVFYDSAITARPYDLEQARQHLQAAGYSPPGASIVVNLAGTETYANGTAKDTVSLVLMETLDNSTYQTSLAQITEITTDTTGKWTFAVYPTIVGTHYYYLVDNSTGTPEYKFIQSYTINAATPTPTASPTAAPTATPAPGTTDYTLVYVAVIVVVIVVVIVAVALVMRRKPKQAS